MSILNPHVLALAFGLGGMLTQLNSVVAGEGYGILLLSDESDAASPWSLCFTRFCRNARGRKMVSIAIALTIFALVVSL